MPSIYEIARQRIAKTATREIKVELAESGYRKRNREQESMTDAKRKRREKMLAYHREWHKAHREEANARSREYAKKHREQNRESCRKYREKHKEELDAYNRKWRLDHPEKVAEYNAKRREMRARKKEM